MFESCPAPVLYQVPLTFVYLILYKRYIQYTALEEEIKWY